MPHPDHPPASSASTTFGPLQHTAYRRVWLTQGISALGTFLHLVAASWVMLELTRSPLLVSLVPATSLAARLAFTLVGGALADVYDRRVILTVGLSVSTGGAVLLASFAGTGRVTPSVLLAASAMLGIGTGISMPAYQSLLPDLVPRPLLPAAVTLSSAGANVARAVGPAVGGALVAADLIVLAFALNGAFLLGAAVTVMTVPDANTPSGGVRGREPLGTALRTGVRYARFTPLIARSLSVAGAFAVTSAAIQALLPTVSADDLGLGGGGFGLLLGMFGLGGLMGAFTREALRRAMPGPAMLPLTIVGFGVTGAAFGLSRTPWLSGALLIAAGVCWVWTLTTLNSTVRMLAPRWAASRVMSMFIIAVVGVQAFGAVLAGGLAEWIGSAPAVGLLSAGAIGLGIVALRLPLPVLGEISEPTAPENWVVPEQVDEVDRNPVLVQTTWCIDPARADEFVNAMRILRIHRLRLGARRWSLFRDVEEPDCMVELFEFVDWEDLLRQGQRVDDDATAAIMLVASFCRDGSSARTRYLVGVNAAGSSGHASGHGSPAHRPSPEARREDALAPRQR